MFTRISQGTDRSRAILRFISRSLLLLSLFSPLAGTRAAQVSLMKESGWKAPFYWAAFTLQGEWR